MRLLLVGTAEQRARLRAEVDNSAFTIAGEFGTLGQARASQVEADAILVGARRPLTGRSRDDDVGVEEALTDREVQVLEFLVHGLSNKAIASRLGISDQTIKFHVASICGKLGAANRTDAVRLGIRRGLVTL